jgi:hypothetical protein
MDPEEPAAEEEGHLLRRAWMTPLKSFRSHDAPTPPEPPLKTAAMTSPPSAPPASLPEERPSAYAEAELHRLIALLRTETDQMASDATHAYVSRHVRLRLLQLLARQPEQALQAIPGLPADEQEFWTHLLWSLANELEPAAEDNDATRISRTADLLAEAQRLLRQQAPLEIVNAGFCHKINSFGNYERFARSEFQPGQAVLLYAELQNFTSELNREGFYQTRLRTEIEIVPAAGQEGAAPIDRRSFPATMDLCRSPRTDYFHSYRLDLPAHLVPGSYVLRLSVIDELGQKSGTEELRFDVR